MGAAQDKEMATAINKVLMVGNQPEGYMTWIYLPKSLPGYPLNDRIELFFEFADGVQTEQHPHPGKQYLGYNTKAYLPNNSEGKKLLKMIKVAFDHKLMFTVMTNGRGEDVVTLCDIPLKTLDDTSGPSSLRYPDSHYLSTVKQILKSKGIHASQARESRKSYRLNSIDMLKPEKD